ncbi:hypothetical protein GW17_00008713 [Ensete ventricosum]|nr:hypothetical protein GW17_00008713 [Ensete ventricosum]
MVASRAVHLFQSSSSVLFLLIYYGSLRDLEMSPCLHLEQSKVCRELAKGIGSLPGWHKGVRRKKTKTRQRLSGVAERLAGSWEGLEVDVYGPRIKLRHQAKVLDDTVKVRQTFARTSPKLSGRSLGTCREIA